MITNIVNNLANAFSQVAGLVQDFLGTTTDQNGLFDAIGTLSSKVF